MTNAQPEDVGDVGDVAVSKQRLQRCLASAKRWTDELPSYADRNQLKADFWAIVAGLLAALTSLSIFPALGEGSGTLAKAIVSVMALASAICALVPRVKNYGEQAGTARVLASQYGSVYGRLLDLVHETPVNQLAAKVMLAEYQSIKEKKDALRELTTWRQKRQDKKAVGPSEPASGE